VDALRDIDKTQRQVNFMQAQIFDPQDTSGDNNTWVYNRAPDGYVFELVKIQISGSRGSGTQQGIVALFDGHEYTHWNIWPGVESRELLFRFDSFDYGVDAVGSLENWECKEYTLAVRSWSETKTFKTCIIVWYNLKKMNSLETLYYAVIQPRWKRFKKAFRRTAERSELGL